MPTETELKAYATSQANANGIPTEIFLNLIDTESDWRSDAVSLAGAQGIAQLMPGTAPDIDRFDPFASLDRAAKLLREYFDKFGSWPLAVAAYNAGPGAVSKYGTIPPYPETQKYVQKIFGMGGGMQTGLKVTTILFWAAAAIIGIIVLGSVAK